MFLSVESPIVNTQCGAISLASLQPPLMTAPPLQPRPATTGSLDLMLPLQPKLLPGYNLQSSYLSNTLSTVRPPDLPKNGKQEDYYKPNFEVIIEKRESISDSVKDNVISDSENVDRDNLNNEENDNHVDNDVNENIDSKDEINSNVIDVSADTSLNFNDDSPNNNSY